MSIWHRHRWMIIARTVCPPKTYSFQIQMSEFLFERVRCGVTSYLLRCESCGAIQHRELLGLESPHEVDRWGGEESDQAGMTKPSPV